MANDGYSYSEIEHSLIEKYGSFTYGESIRPHSKKKIEYISKYVDRWLYVVTNCSERIFFIDIMSNAGLYKNKYLSTSIEILNIFISHAKSNPNKQFNLICNDIDKNRVETTIKIFKLYEGLFKKYNINNIKLLCFNEDATDFLNNTIGSKLNYFNGTHSKKSILLYVDPYHLIEDKLASACLKFANRFYSEIIINFDSNDYVRNKFNYHLKNKQKQIEDFVTNFCRLNLHKTNLKDVLDSFINMFKKQSKMKYHYYFLMKNSKNAPLYHLIFLTPHIKGLEKVKDATWEVIGIYKEFSINQQINYDPDLFEKNDEDYVYEDAQRKFIGYVSKGDSSILKYDDCLLFLLENTSLKKSHLINKIFKPLINEGKLIKMGYVNNNNYSGDQYKINLGECANEKK